MPLLVITPKPHAFEAPLGYILRLSECNGYKNSWFIYQLIYDQLDGNNSERYGLAKILGVDENSLEHLNYGPINNDLLHDRSPNLKDFDLSSFMTKRTFCPQCVKEEGYIDVFWSLRLVVACPRHGCELLSHCQACGKEIYWNRPGLLRCQCGADYSQAKLKQVDSKVAELMQIISEKFHGNSIENLPNNSGYPLKELSLMPVKTLLLFLDSLARDNCRSQQFYKRLKTDAEIVIFAKDLLSQWPNNFHNMIFRLNHIRTLKQPNRIDRYRFITYKSAIFEASKWSKNHTNFIFEEFNQCIENWRNEDVISDRRHKYDAPMVAEPINLSEHITLFLFSNESHLSLYQQSA